MKPPETYAEASEARKTTAPARSAGVPQRPAGHPREQRVVALVVLAQRAGQLGLHPAGRDAVDADAAARPLVGQRAGEPEQPMLGRRVGRDVHAAVEGVHGDDVDDAAAPPVRQQRTGERLREQERRRQVEGDDACQSSAGVSSAGARRIIPALLTRTLRSPSSARAHATSSSAASGVSADRSALARATRTPRRRGPRLHVDRGDVRARLGERERHRLAQPARRARDERAATAEREQLPAHRMSVSRYPASTPTDS